MSGQTPGYPVDGGDAPGPVSSMRSDSIHGHGSLVYQGGRCARIVFEHTHWSGSRPYVGGMYGIHEQRFRASRSSAFAVPGPGYIYKGISQATHCVPYMVENVAHGRCGSFTRVVRSHVSVSSLFFLYFVTWARNSHRHRTSRVSETG